MGSDTPVIIEAASLSRNTIGAGDLGLSRPTSQRHLLEEWASDVIPTPVPRRHWRHDDGGIDRVDADVVLAQFKADTRVMLSRAALEAPYEMWPGSATRLA